MATKSVITVANTFDVISAILADVSDETINVAIHATLQDSKADAAAFRDKVEHMNANAHKAGKPRAKQPSAASIRNANDAKLFAEKWDHSKAFTLANVGDIIPTRITAQSRIAITNVLLADKSIEKDGKVDGHMAYKFTA